MCDSCEWTLATVAEDNILQIWQVVRDRSPVTCSPTPTPFPSAPARCNAA